MYGQPVPSSLITVAAQGSPGVHISKIKRD